MRRSCGLRNQQQLLQASSYLVHLELYVQLDEFNGDLKRYGRPFGAEGAPPMPFLRAFGGSERLSRDDLAREMKHGAKLAKVLRAA